MTPTPVPVDPGAPTINDRNIAVIRTVVPGVIGLLIALFTKWVADQFGWEWDLTGFTGVISPVVVAVFIGVYYKLAQLASARIPQLGWLLGYPATPSYTKPGDVPVAPVVGPPVEEPVVPVDGTTTDPAEDVIDLPINLPEQPPLA